MRTFVDVGAHNGQTLDEVLSHTFDRIIAFEPMPAQYAHLAAHYTDPRLELINAGLAERDGVRGVYGDNQGMEASIYADKTDVDDSVVTVCDFLDASAFFAGLSGDVVVKLNCEGSECLILDRLIDTGDIWTITHLMVDFDVRKIPGQKHRERDTLAKLQGIGFDRFALSETVMIGETHQDRIRHWLGTL